MKRERRRSLIARPGAFSGGGQKVEQRRRVYSPFHYSVFSSPTLCHGMGWNNAGRKYACSEIQLSPVWKMGKQMVTDIGWDEACVLRSTGVRNSCPVQFHFLIFHCHRRIRVQCSRRAGGGSERASVKNFLRHRRAQYDNVSHSESTWINIHTRVGGRAVMKAAWRRSWQWQLTRRLSIKSRAQHGPRHSKLFYGVYGTRGMLKNK